MTLFKDRDLGIAILVSVLWHFVFIFSIKPVLPVGHIIEHKTSIAFLGDILEKVVPGNERPFTLDHVSLDNKIDKPEPGGTGFINIQPQDKELLYSVGYQSPLRLNAYRKKETSRVYFSDFFIKGEARDRILIYKPVLSEVTVIPSDFSSDFSANVRFRISKDGFVKYAECATSSGNPEIDQMAIRYVRKWQFVPAAEDDQEGTVRVSFK
jgi:TonB family protein